MHIFFLSKNKARQENLQAVYFTIAKFSDIEEKKNILYKELKD